MLWRQRVRDLDVHADMTDFELGFGVTSKVWDYVFGTVLPVLSK
jgi:sterol desaturase/sphingolipid hydroxylase (fatty acid hydroxylase superfamily)